MRSRVTAGLGLILLLAPGLSPERAAGDRVPPMEPLGVLRVPEKLLRDSGVPPPRDYLPGAQDEAATETEAPPATRGSACVVAGDGTVLHAPPGRTCK